MRSIIATAIFCFIVWLFLTASGSLWSIDVIIAGIILSIITGVIAHKIFIKDYTLAHPKRWLILLVYLFYFFYEMAKANIDVAYRVITGKINPGIIKIAPGLKSDLAVTFLANSITLTPGTLSVDVDQEKNLYVHWINIDENALAKKPRPCEPICASFPKWARRMGE
jgi:multicomponent Na+:H+ antiporter subunit E